jgi:GNAT superfamily N-acetyltransferase
MVEIRAGTPADDPTLIEHFLAMWTDLGTPAAAIVPDAAERIAAFVGEARADYAFASIHAVEGGEIVGTACSQRYRAPYPDILTPERRLYGYIWGVYVVPSARRRGLAGRLTEATLDHLRALGCHRAILNASPPGEGVYRALGFEPSNERFLDLT